MIKLKQSYLDVTLGIDNLFTSASLHKPIDLLSHMDYITNDDHSWVRYLMCLIYNITKCTSNRFVVLMYPCERVRLAFLMNDHVSLINHISGSRLTPI